MSRFQLGSLIHSIQQGEKQFQQGLDLQRVVHGSAATQTQEFKNFSAAQTTHKNALDAARSQLGVNQQYLGQEALTQQAIVEQYYAGQYQKLIHLVSTVNGNHLQHVDSGSTGFVGQRIYYKDQNHLTIFHSIMRDLGFDTSRPNLLTAENKDFLETFGTKAGYLTAVDNIVHLQHQHAKQHYELEVTSPKPLDTLIETGKVLQTASKAVAGIWAQ